MVVRFSRYWYVSPDIGGLFAEQHIVQVAVDELGNLADKTSISKHSPSLANE